MAIDALNARFSKPLYEITPALFDPYPGESDYRPIHPGIEYFPNGWNGFKWWMVYTPYPNADSEFENPTIAVSNDLETWIQPPGIFQNPIVDTPLGVGNFNADTDLFYDSASDQLCMIYRERLGGATTNNLKMMVTSDGLSWGDGTTEGDQLTLKTGSTTSQDFATPSLMKVGSTYRIYFINGDNVADPAVYKDIEYVESSSLESGYGAITTIPEINLPSNDVTWWNMYIKFVDGEYVGFIQDAPERGSAGDLYTLKSTDGTNFTTQLVYPSAAFYRCCFAITPINLSGQQYYYAFLAGVAEDQYIRISALSFNATAAEAKRIEVNALQGAADPITDATAIHRDDFNRPNQSGLGTSSDGSTPDSGGGSSDWEILDGKARQSSAGNKRVTYTSGATSMFIRAQFGELSAGRDQWIITRFSAINSYVRIGHDGSGDLKVQVINPGVVPFDVVFVDRIQDNEELEIRVNPSGYVIELLTTGGISFVDNTDLNGATDYGFQTDAVGAEFNYFNVLTYDADVQDDRYVIDLNILPDGLPILTTQYSSRMNISGDVVSAIDFSVGWVGASSFVITGLPNGLIATDESVAGTIVAPTGTFITNVAATNSFGTTNMQFQWTTLTTGDPTSGINVPINKTI